MKHENGFVCICNEGYDLEPDGKTCSGVLNFVYAYLMYLVYFLSVSCRYR